MLLLKKSCLIISTRIFSCIMVAFTNIIVFCSLFTQINSFNLWITQRVVTRYTLHGSRLPSHRGQNCICSPKHITMLKPFMEQKVYHYTNYVNTKQIDPTISSSLVSLTTTRPTEDRGHSLLHK